MRTRQEYRPGERSNAPFQFTLRRLLYVVTVFAVACGTVKALGPHGSLGLARAGFPWAVFLMQAWQLGKPGPKRLGFISFVSIMAVRVFLRVIMGGPRNPLSEPSLFFVVLMHCLTTTLCIVWLCFSVRAILTRTSPNLKLGLLSLVWIMDPYLLLYCDALQDVLSHWAPAIGNVRPFRTVGMFIWDG